MSPTNFYFNNFGASNEQTVLDDLVVESIKVHGLDMWYMPRTTDTKDEIFTESPISSFNSAYMVPIYIEAVDGFSGDGNFLSRFGLEIRDQMTFTIAVKTFQDDVVAEENDIILTRPREGDLIWFPLPQRLFQIMFVEKFKPFYQLGSLHTWTMRCEFFEYSSEHFNTGITEIDALERKYTADMLQWSVRNEDNDYMITEANNIWMDEAWNVTSPEPWTDNQNIQDESDVFVDFSSNDIFSEGNI